MFKHRYSINNSFTLNSSLYLTQCGTDDCLPNQTFGPVFRDHNLMHFIFDGKGTIEMFGTKYEVQSGDGFLIPTGINCKTTANTEFPWSYCWMGFDGVDSSRILSYLGLNNNPIFKFSEPEQLKLCFSDLINYYEKDGNSFAALCKMFEIFSHIIPNRVLKTEQSNILNKSIEYIEKNYMNDISVEDIAANFNISRCQLYRIFSSFVNMSPSNYIISYRINHAAELLRTTDLPISDIARLSGFNDSANFYQQFKKIYHRGPKEFRKFVKENSVSWDMKNSPQ